MKLRRWVFLALGTMLLAVVVNPLAGWLALKKLERKAGAPIRGSFYPHLLFPAFSLKNASFNWQGRFQVRSGTVEVRYDPFSLLPAQKFRARIEARDLPVSFSGELAASQGFSQLNVDRVTADLAFFEKGSPEIFLFDVRSREMTFRLAKAES